MSTEGRIGLDAGVVDQNVQRAEAGDDRRQHRFDARLVADVRRHRHRLAAVGSDLGDDLGRGIGLDGEVVHRHPRTGPAERQRRGPADAGAGAGDERDVACEGYARCHDDVSLPSGT